MEFKLWIAEDEAEALVFREVPDELREVFGDALKEHTFTVREPVRAAAQMEAERLMWAPDPVMGARRDEALRPAAMCVAHLERWTLPQELSMTGCAELKPPVLDAVWGRVNDIVFPTVATSGFFARWKTRQGGSSG